MNTLDLLGRNGRDVDWDLVRGEFDLDPEFTHLSAFWVSSHPRQVREAIDYHRRRLDGSPYRYVVDNEERLEQESMAAIASLIGAHPDEIVVTHSTTEGLSVVYGGIQLSSDDHVITTQHDHYSTATAVHLLVQRTGSSISEASLYTDGEEIDPAEVVAKLVALVNDRTRLIAITWVHSSTGVKLPMEELCKNVSRVNLSRADDRKIIVVVDATHAFGAFQFDVSTIGCDFLIAACHKWLYGPRGTAFIWGRTESLGQIREVIPSFASSALRVFMGMARSGEVVPAAQRLRPGGFSCFEHRWAIPAAVAFFSRIGPSVVERRLVELTTILKVVLSGLPNVKVITPLESDSSAAIICFEVLGESPEAVVSFLLDRKIVASVSPYRRRYARLTPGIYNTPGDIFRAGAAIKELCGGPAQ